MTVIASQPISGLQSELDQAIYSGVVRILRLWMIAIPALGLVTWVFQLFDESLKPLQHRLLLLIAGAFVFNAINLLLLQRSRPGQWSARLLQALGLVYPLVTPVLLVVIIADVRPDELRTWVGSSIPQLQLLMIAASLFGFTFWVSFSAGLISAVIYLFICFFVPDPYRPDTPHIIESAVYLLTAGAIAGKGASESRNLVSKVVESIKSHEFLSRLLGAYVSEEVKERIMEQGLNLKGEECEVTVLFSDLRDFTSLSEKLSPVTVVDILNLYFERMVQIISEEGGVVDKFMGDAIMAYFGAPVSLPAPRRSAVQAALRMHKELQTLNETLNSDFGIRLRAGVGLHHGRVVMGNIGSNTRRDFTIIGDTVNIAARLESMTSKTGSWLILSKEVEMGLEEKQRQELHSLEELTLKGRKQPVVCFGRQEQKDD
ncbi:MAG: hypothetical protein KDK23_15770 [Leptospiraceae bacterium]|nr:hypothetical protein [Leptospiraceae bacterium]